MSPDFRLLPLRFPEFWRTQLPLNPSQALDRVTHDMPIIDVGFFDGSVVAKFCRRLSGISSQQHKSRLLKKQARSTFG